MAIDPSRYTFREFLQPIGLQALQCLKADPRRVGIIFAALTTSVYYVSTLPSLVVPRGIPVSNTAITVEIYWARHGPLVTNEWYCIHPTGAASITIIEVKEID